MDVTRHRYVDGEDADEALGRQPKLKRMEVTLQEGLASLTRV